MGCNPAALILRKAKMPYHIEYDKVEKIIVTTVKGEMQLVDLIKVGLGIARLVKQSGCTMLLIDILEAELLLSLLDVNVFLGAAFETIHAAGVDFYALRQALLTREDQEIPQLLETIGTEHGLKVKVFQDRAEACTWLKDETSVD